MFTNTNRHTRTHTFCVKFESRWILQFAISKLLISHEMCFIFFCFLHFGFDCSNTPTDTHTHTHSHWVALMCLMLYHVYITWFSNSEMSPDPLHSLFTIIPTNIYSFEHQNATLSSDVDKVSRVESEWKMGWDSAQEKLW